MKYLVGLICVDSLPVTWNRQGQIITDEPDTSQKTFPGDAEICFSPALVCRGQMFDFLHCCLWPYLKPVAEWRERLIGRCFPVVTFICLITEQKVVQVKEFAFAIIANIQNSVAGAALLEKSSL